MVVTEELLNGGGDFGDSGELRDKKIKEQNY